VDREFSQGNSSGARAFVQQPASDLSRRVQNFALVQTPPRNFLTTPHWVQVNWSSANNAIATSGITQINLAFALGNIDAVSAYTAIYDQYCIYAVKIRALATAETGLSGYTGRIATAIDYDNISTLSGLAALEDYGSVVESEFEPAMSYERFIKPCVAPTVWNGSASVVNAYGISRMWLDSASASVPHYGYRSIFSGNVTSGLGVDFFVTYILGFRNNV
jgi:hypothetical protein